jgi:F-type H+-transporting ATPase subunit b
MLDLNITLVFQLVNFFIAVYVLNILLIRPLRKIIKERKEVMDGMSEETNSFEYQAEERLANYEAELTAARQGASANREQGRTEGASEQQQLMDDAQQKARKIMAESRANLEAQAQATLEELRKQVDGFSAKLADRLVKGA